MSASETIFHHACAHGERGASIPGKRVPCRTPEGAIRCAEKALAASTVAHVLRVALDAEAEE